MYKLIFTLALLCFQFLYSQDVTGQLGQEIELPVNYQIPVTPQSSSLNRYGETPVDYAHGLSNTSIPIAEIELDGVRVPISISYHAGGISVNQVATSVGLGWTLNVGGEINRQINMLADDELYGWFNIDENNNSQYVPDSLLILNNYQHPYWDDSTWMIHHYETMMYFADVYNNRYDTQPDQFSYQFNGHSGSFVLSKDKAVKESERSNLIYEVGFEQCSYPDMLDLDLNDFGNASFIYPSSKIKDFHIKDREGVCYYFDERAYNSIYEIDPNLYTTVMSCMDEYTYVPVKISGVGTSSWKLSKISTKNFHDIEYFYSHYESSSMVKNWTPANTYSLYNIVQSPEYCIEAITPGQSSPVNYRAFNRLIDSISIGDKSYVKFYYGDQPNMVVWQKSLDSICIYDKSTGDRKLVEFEYSYFYNDGEKRLKLSRVRDKGWASQGTDELVHSFSYNDLLFKRNSTAQDIFGYYNGATTNTCLMPVYWSGSYADREVEHDSITSGLLKRINYPTDGFSDFIYEPNYYTQTDGDSVYMPGTRIKEIRHFSDIDDTVSILQFDYGKITSYKSHTRGEYSKYFESGYSISGHTFSVYYSNPIVVTLETEGFHYDTVAVSKIHYYDTGLWDSEGQPIMMVRDIGSTRYIYGGYIAGNRSNSLLSEAAVFNDAGQVIRKTEYENTSPQNQFIRGAGCGNSFKLGFGCPSFVACSWATRYEDLYAKDFQYSDEKSLKTRERVTEYLDYGDVITDTYYYYEDSLNLVDSIYMEGSENEYAAVYDYYYQSEQSGLMNNFDALRTQEHRYTDNMVTGGLRTEYLGGNPVYHEMFNPEDGLYEWKDSLIYYQSINKPNEVITHQGDYHTIFYSSSTHHPVVITRDIAYWDLVSAMSQSLPGSYTLLTDFVSALESQQVSNVDWESFNTDLRSHVDLVGKEVQTYRFHGLKGMLEQCDSNGQSTYYEYDIHGRLENIRDSNGDLLQKTHYNYTNQF